MLAAALCNGRETRANFHAFYGVDTHQSVSEIGFELVEYRFAEANRLRRRSARGPRGLATGNE